MNGDIGENDFSQVITKKRPVPWNVDIIGIKRFFKSDLKKRYFPRNVYINEEIVKKRFFKKNIIFTSDLKQNDLLLEVLILTEQ